MIIKNLHPGSWGSNCYVFIENGHAMVVDPSAGANVILSYIKSQGAVLDFILLTHGHFDHIVSLDDIRATENVPAYIHQDDVELLADGEKNAYKTFFGVDKTYAPAEKILKHNDTIEFAGHTLKVFHTPGHTNGCICILGDDFMITGDTVFANSHGRCDLYGGSYSNMKKSLTFLKQFDKNLTIYPGHGPISTLGPALNTCF